MLSIFLSLSLAAWSLDSGTEELVLIKGGWCNHFEAYPSDLPDYRHQGKTGEKRQKMKRKEKKKKSKETSIVCAGNRHPRL